MLGNKNQLDLFHVQRAYANADGPLSNDELYQSVASLAGIAPTALNEQSAIGVAQSKRSKIKRKIRWLQQTLKSLNLLQKVEGQRGVWELTSKNKKGLHEALGGVKLLAYSTHLGIAVWTNSKSFFKSVSEPIHLVISSPPYPLKIQRGYGNVAESQWVDFITEALEPVVKNLVPGGSVVINISNDIFESNSPSRSLYVERMVIALHDRLGLSLMDRWPWINMSKPPGPTYWACVNRYQLCVAWEPIFWFCNDPSQVRSDNCRVLQPHTEKHKKFLAEGNKRITNYGDGAYKLRDNSYSSMTEGSIPKNVIIRGHSCADTLELRRHAQSLGLPAHPAMFPTSIPDMAIKFLTKPGETVVDLFSGSNKVGLAAERNGRHWIACEIILEYIRTQAEMFRQFDGFWINPSILAVGEYQGDAVI